MTTEKIVLEVHVNAQDTSEIEMVRQAAVEALEAMFSLAWTSIILSSRIVPNSDEDKGLPIE